MSCLVSIQAEYVNEYHRYQRYKTYKKAESMDSALY